jgi:hypothetical protein
VTGPHALLRSAAASLLLLGACAEAAPPIAVSDLCALQLTSTPPVASVFLDARYVGETGPEGALRIVRAPGACQLRVSARGHCDLIMAIELAAGRAVTARVDLAPKGSGATAFAADVRIDVGQIVRAELGLPATGGARPVRFHVYAFDARRGQRRSIVLHSATNPVDIGVLGPDGAIVELSREDHPSGNPPEVTRLRCPVERDGRYRLVVRAAVPAHYVVGLEKAIPDLYDGEEPAPPARRFPGERDESY